MGRKYLDKSTNTIVEILSVKIDPCVIFTVQSVYPPINNYLVSLSEFLSERFEEFIGDTYYVICLNDGMYSGSFNKEIAIQEMNRLSLEHYENNKHNYSNICQSYEEYLKTIGYWHLHEVKRI